MLICMMAPIVGISRWITLGYILGQRHLHQFYDVITIRLDLYEVPAWERSFSPKLRKFGWRNGLFPVSIKKNVHLYLLNLSLLFAFVPFRGCVFALAAKEMQVISCDNQMFLHKKSRDYSRPSCGSLYVPLSFRRHDKAPSVDGHILLIVLLLGRDQGAAPQTVRALAAVFTACGTCGILFADRRIFGAFFGERPRAIPSTCLQDIAVRYCTDTIRCLLHYTG